MPEICKTDLNITIRYLEDALKAYRGSQSTAIFNRIRLIKIHINKLKSKLNDKTGHH